MQTCERYCDRTQGTKMRRTETYTMQWSISPLTQHRRDSKQERSASQYAPQGLCTSRVRAELELFKNFNQCASRSREFKVCSVSVHDEKAYVVNIEGMNRCRQLYSISIVPLVTCKETPQYGDSSRLPLRRGFDSN